MDYAEALRQLEARTPERIGPSLDRITAMCELMGDPNLAYPSIHVTGTNGKTSVTRMVSSLLAALGLQAGTYTSPHLQTVRERLAVAGRPVAEDVFAELFDQVAAYAAVVDVESEVPTTYFELLTAMAYTWFADHPVDVGVFEVGMGGRWDATNLVRGEVAVITSIALDHPELGATTAEVTREKAGIIKPGATVMCGPLGDDLRAIVEAEARAQGATLLDVGAVAVTARAQAVGGQVVTLRTPTATYDDVYVPLHGRHQAENAAVALGAIHGFLGGLDRIADDVVRAGFAAVTVPGRLEVVAHDPTVVLDGAHNPAGAARTAEGVTEAFAFRDLVLVVACLADKDIAGILEGFRGVASHVVVTAVDSPRAASLEAMRDAAAATWRGTSVVVETADSVAEAIEKARGVAGPLDGVLVTGSLYLVGAARDAFVPADA